MALKTLLLRKKLDDKKKDLEALRGKDADFQRREAELEAAIGEAESSEDQQAVEGLVGEFDADKQAHEEAKNTLTREIAELEQQLTDEEDKQPPAASNSPEEKTSRECEERKDEFVMSMKHRGFFGLDVQRRDQFLARDDVKDFLQRVRSIAKEKRAVSGAELTIPDVVLELIRNVIPRYSKLIARVNLKPVPGTARQNIMGTVPEAVWTEACATLNELDLYFNQVEVDGYKVGGFIAVCNATLEDSDLNLATEIMDAIGQAIGYAIDKAIVYGTGKKMPVGIVTRLAQTAQPENWGTNAPEWKDLSTSNVITITDKSGLALYKEIILKSGAADHTYSRGPLTWIMNELTKNTLTAEALSINAAGAIVSGQGNTMPVLGGDIVTLDFIPNGDIIFGYMDLYLLVQRAGAQMAASEHVRFLDDQTVFKGTARYDGKPVFGEAFGVINISGAAPTTTAQFAPDKANPELVSLSLGTAVLTPNFDPAVTAYHASTSAASNTITATGSAGSQVAIEVNGKAQANGVSASWSDGDNTVKVTVSFGGHSKVYTMTVNKAGT